MNAHDIVLDSPSRESVVPERILRTALAALRHGDFDEVVDQFNDQFTFIDHALELEFKDKTRAIEFFAEAREFFSDSVRTPARCSG